MNAMPTQISGRPTTSSASRYTPGSRMRIVLVSGAMAVATGCGGPGEMLDDHGTEQTRSALTGDPCTTNAQCNDGNACTVDSCVQRKCGYTNRADGAACSDGNACTGADACHAGTCVGGSSVVCAAPNQCQIANGCNPVTGACVYFARAGAACDDGNSCTQNDSCTTSVAGVCRGTGRSRGSACDDLNPCTQNDQCRNSGACAGRARPNGSACDDGNPNTAGDVCMRNACAGVDRCVGVVCAASNQCHLAGTCVDHATGACSNPSAADGTPCDDGSPITFGDQCSAGACAGLDRCVGVACAASNQCHLAGTCVDHATGACSNPSAADGTACDDGNPETAGDVCRGGACAGVGPGCSGTDATGVKWTWTNLTPTPLPAAWPSSRWTSVVVYDSRRSKLMLFGGVITTPSFDSPVDVWEWDFVSRTWTDRTPSPRPSSWPPPRAYQAAVYDSGRDRVLLFGGSKSHSTNYNDLWEWDPTTNEWTDRTTATLPSAWPAARNYHGMVYAESQGLVFLHGGTTGTNVFNDLWSLNVADATWTNRPPPLGPSSWMDMQLGWDESRKSVFFWGQFSSIARDFNPATNMWTNMWTTSPGFAPIFRNSSAFAFDSTTGRALLFGGSLSTGSTPTDELWRWGALSRRWTEVAPAPHPACWPSARSAQGSVSLGTDRAVIFGNTGFSRPNELWTLETACTSPACADGDACVTSACQPFDGCHLAGVCINHSTGACSNPVALDGTTCDDGTSSTSGDVCLAGVCTGDVNECTTNNGGCSVNATCSNSFGSRSCACNYGFKGDGITCNPRPRFSQISSGLEHVCAVTLAGQVLCWGNNTLGQASPPPDTFTKVSAGEAHTCGIHTDGTLVCWGDNANGQATPQSGVFLQVSAGNTDTCAIRPDRTLACWGAGPGINTPPSGAFLDVSVGDIQSCAVRDSGTAVCWGRNSHGQTTPPSGIFVSVAAGALHSCGLLTSGFATCWGDNTWGESTPPPEAFAQIASGWNHMLGRRPDGTLVSWGLGTNTFRKAVAGVFVAIDSGMTADCGLDALGYATCWGFDTWGQTNPP